MREYIVQPGDSPAKIAAEHAGCPKCARDLIAAYPDKATVVYPNGFRTFKDPLRVGEKLILPEKWFSKEFDELPPAYFAALPHPDGVTPSKLGARAAGVLGDYATFDSALAHAAMLAPMPLPEFSAAVDQVGALLNQSVSEVPASAGGPAQDVRAATAWARKRNMELATALKSGNTAEADTARTSIQNVLLTAIDSARLALQATYGTAQTPVPTIAVVAQAAAAAIAADPDFCASVARPGSPVNSAVHAFKTAWNTANPSAPVPINTGTYEQATVDAMTRALGTAAPVACVPQVRVEFGTPVIDSPRPQPDRGLSVGAIVGLGLLGAGAVGVAIYLATNAPKAAPPRVRRIRPRPSPERSGPMLRPERHDTIPPWRHT